MKNVLVCFVCASSIVGCGDSRARTDGGPDEMHDSGGDMRDAGEGTRDSGEPFTALFADIQYATRCELAGGCPGHVDHDICGFHDSDPCDGAGTPIISCEITEATSTRTITFTAQQGAGFSLGIASLTVPFAGGSAAGGACRVTVDEGANRYSGACGSSPPSEVQPCQITDVTFRDDMGNAEFEGTIFCQFLANTATPSLQIEVTAIGSGPTAAASPGRFRISNCAGLTL